MQVARSRGAHFARPDQKPAAGTGGMAASGGGGGSGSGRGPGNARGRGRAVRVGDGRVEGEAAPELWPGPFAEARRVSHVLAGRYGRRKRLVVVVVVLLLLRSRIAVGLSLARGIWP